MLRDRFKGSRAVRAAVVLGLALYFGSAQILPVRAAIPMGQPVDGIRCDAAEGVAFHIHQHLAIFNRGKAVAMPDDIGRPIVGNCLYWLHTHTADGVIHVESPAVRTFTLGQFFDVWGRPLTRSNVAGIPVSKASTVRVWLNGRPFAGDPRGIELTQHADIAIAIGPPFGKPVPFTRWQGL